jgi:hypothetical protein
VEFEAVRGHPGNLGMTLVAYNLCVVLWRLGVVVTWEVLVVEPALSWLHELRRTDRRTLVLISQAIDALSIEGPALGRPLVDTVKGSSLSNLKELRPGSAGASEVRLLFVFDPQRQAVILVGGDKSGNWRGWYRTAIPLAEAAYVDHVERMGGRGGVR